MCLFGEHSDWAGSYSKTYPHIKDGIAIVCGIEQGIYARVEKSSTFRFRTASRNDGWIEYPLIASAMGEIAAFDGFYSYIAGVMTYILQHFDVGGVSIDCYKETLPIGKGLSSSAAICVLIIRAYNLLYGLSLSKDEEMEIAYQGELLTSSRCGRLDQACAYGKNPVQMTFSGDILDVSPIYVGKDLYWVYAQLNGKKNTKAILSSLHACFPHAYTEVAINVQHALGLENQRIVKKALQAIQDGDPIRIGLCMNEAENLFNAYVSPACPEELESPILKSVLNDVRIRQLSLGAKGVGSHGDGCVQFICMDENQQHLLMERLEELGTIANAFTIRATNIVRKAIIPIAGLGTRLFPATRVVRKEFFPILDKDGMMKPVLLVLLEELLEAGIEEIALIIQTGTQPEYERLFGQEDSSLEGNYPSQYLEYMRRLRDIGSHIVYIEQMIPMGLGHAVFQARDFAQNEPLLVSLGDHLYKSHSRTNCTKQLIDAYRQCLVSIVSIDRIELDKVSYYGIITGRFSSENSGLLRITAAEEKPSIEYARSNLTVFCEDNEAQFYSFFGQYILTSDAFDALDRIVCTEEKKYVNYGEKEIQLTNALDLLAQNGKLWGCIIDGKRFDIGLPSAYCDTLEHFSRSVNGETCIVT